MIKSMAELLPINVDGAIVASEVNRRYLLDFYSSAGMLFITREQNYFLVDFRYFEIAQRVIKNANVILLTDAKKQLSELIKKHKVKTIAIESYKTTVAEFENLNKNYKVKIDKSNEFNDNINNLRATKTKLEISNIIKAQEITDKAFSHILGFMKKGKTEREIAIELEFFMKKNGADEKAFDIIVASGQNSSMPHATPTEKKINSNEFIVLDFGASVNGYKSDMTRTVAVGEANSKMIEVYNIVLEAQKKAIEAIDIDIECNIIDKVARDFIEKSGYKDCFGHGLGHSVGLEIHESPSFSPNNKTKTKDGMIITVEPGIYLKGEFGVRIEDLILLKEKSPENLTKSEKQMIVL